MTPGYGLRLILSLAMARLVRGKTSTSHHPSFCGKVRVERADFLRMETCRARLLAEGELGTREEAFEPEERHTEPKAT